MALTADHGVAPIPERARAEGLDARRIPVDTLAQAVEQTLTNAFGPERYVASLARPSPSAPPHVGDKPSERR